MKKLTTEQFIKRAKEVHGDKYDYSKTIYKNSHSKVVIICKEHGEFECVAYKHINKKQGCKKCSIKNITATNESFILKAKILHKNKYNYDKVKYVNSATKVTITCPIHGDFEQRPNDHLKGQGCPECSKEKVAKLKKENPRGWTTTEWKKASEKSENFDSFKVYIIKCYNDNEEFYKIGKTFTKIENRFDSKGRMPYDYEVLKIFEGEAKKMSKLEKQLQKDNKEFKYLPLLVFNGYNECFKKVTINE